MDVVERSRPPSWCSDCCQLNTLNMYETELYAPIWYCPVRLALKVVARAVTVQFVIAETFFIFIRQIELKRVGSANLAPRSTRLLPVTYLTVFDVFLRT